MPNNRYEMYSARLGPTWTSGAGSREMLRRVKRGRNPKAEKSAEKRAKSHQRSGVELGPSHEQVALGEAKVSILSNGKYVEDNPLP